MSHNRVVHISFDYELFFGGDTGTIEKCMLEPVAELQRLSKEQGVPMIFFIDAGYLWQLKNHRHVASCARDYLKISEQIRNLDSEGHQIALHVHPHWEDSTHDGQRWQLSTRRYKLSDFSQAEAAQIISKYHQALQDITGKKCALFRAGGWCIQPFRHISAALEANGIFTDSSVYPGGFHSFSAQSYDFRNAPQKQEWRFSADECAEDREGKFREIAITPDRISPLFYYSLYLRMKVNPGLYRPLGDGRWLKDKKKVYRQFYASTRHFACCDGFFASRLPNILKKLEAGRRNKMMILGHPKSLAPYSIQALGKFISFAKERGWSFSVIE